MPSEAVPPTNLAYWFASDCLDQWHGFTRSQIFHIEWCATRISGLLLWVNTPAWAFEVSVRVLSHTTCCTEPFGEFIGMVERIVLQHGPPFLLASFQLTKNSVG